MKKSLDDSVPLKSKDGTKSFLTGVLLDAYRGVNNKLLEYSLHSYNGLINAETQAKEKMNVKTK